jgi:FixJ family two-component response regulator
LEIAISTPVSRPHAVAVVDDDPSLGKALTRLLTANGFRVELFASSKAFMSAASSLDATCVIVDINLGDGSGFDLARRFVDFGLRIPIIFMTGGHDEAIRARCVELGCVAFLVKPFTEERLIEAIAEATGSKLSA